MAEFSEIDEIGIIAAQGPDAGAFLHAQLTSDVAGLAEGRTQYSGYCSPKGRLLATFLIWREHGRFLLLLPRSLREAVQTRLSKYVLRSKVTLTDATPGLSLFGVWGSDASQVFSQAAGAPPERPHEIASGESASSVRLPVARYLVMSAAEQAPGVRPLLAAHARERPGSEWSRLDIEAGIASITPASQELYVPQMANLDLIGAVSYTKGCYPGQEIVARMHYLGRLKQRMYRIHLIHRASDPPPAAGDALYSAAFGPDQASGAILSAAPAPGGGHDALAVVQIAAAAGDPVRWKTPDGPAVDFKPLPYPVPA